MMCQVLTGGELARSAWLAGVIGANVHTRMFSLSLSFSLAVWIEKWRKKIQERLQHERTESLKGRVADITHLSESKGRVWVYSGDFYTGGVFLLLFFFRYSVHFFIGHFGSAKQSQVMTRGQRLLNWEQFIFTYPTWVYESLSGLFKDEGPQFCAQRKSSAKWEWVRGFLLLAFS